MPPSQLQPEERQLLALLQQQDPVGFTRMYTRYAPVLYGVTLRMVHSPALAEDVLQEAFIKIWRKMDSYDPQRGRLFTWLLNVVRNTAIDALRSQRNRPTQATRDSNQFVSWPPANQHLLPTTHTPIDHIGVDHWLASLSEEHQQLIEYCYFKGYSHQETAKALHLPLGTMKTKLRRALLELRKHLSMP